MTPTERSAVYHGADWRAVLRRCGRRCEHCGRPDRALVYAARDGSGRWSSDLSAILGNYRIAASSVRLRIGRRRVAWCDCHGVAAPAPSTGYLWRVRVVLGAALRVHDNGARGAQNLLALCQRCMRIHDARWNLERRRERKDRMRPIFEAVAQAEIRV